MTKRFEKIAVAVMLIALGVILWMDAHAAWRYIHPTPEPVTHMFIIPQNPGVERLNKAELAVYRAKILRDDPDAARIMRVEWKGKRGCPQRNKSHCS